MRWVGVGFLSLLLAGVVGWALVSKNTPDPSKPRTTPDFTSSRGARFDPRSKKRPELKLPEKSAPSKPDQAQATPIDEAQRIRELRKLTPAELLTALDAARKSDGVILIEDVIDERLHNEPEDGSMARALLERLLTGVDRPVMIKRLAGHLASPMVRNFEIRLATLRWLMERTRQVDFGGDYRDDILRSVLTLAASDQAAPMRPEVLRLMSSEFRASRGTGVGNSLAYVLRDENDLRALLENAGTHNAAALRSIAKVLSNPKVGDLPIETRTRWLSWMADHVEDPALRSEINGSRDKLRVK